MKTLIIRILFQVQQAYHLSGDSFLTQSNTEYFMNRVSRRDQTFSALLLQLFRLLLQVRSLAEHNYVPCDQDILRAHIKSKGITEVFIVYSQIKLELIYDKLFLKLKYLVNDILLVVHDVGSQPPPPALTAGVARVVKR